MSDQLLGELPRPLEQLAVGPQAGESKLRHAGLPRAEELALAAQLEILLRQLEPVRRLDQGLQALPRVVGQLLLGAGDQQAVRLLGAPTDPPPQLMELREPEAVGLLDDHDR